jgi:cleavage and polyadenylation specificity factor subunit 2
MESIIYAVDWNQARENVMGGAAWFGGHGGSEVIEPLRKPTALVCSSKNGNTPSVSGGRQKRDQLLLDNIRSSLSKGGTVLIPSDSSARVLELAHVLERAWQESSNDNTLRNAKVYMASRSATATMKHAQSLLEWMDDSIIREFEGEDDNPAKAHKRGGSKQTNGVSAKPTKPFELQYMKMIERPKQLEKALRRDGPKVILASDLSYEWGLSRLALQEIAQKAENLVIFTEKTIAASETQSATVAQSIWEIFDRKEDGVALEKASDGNQIEQVHTGGKRLNLTEVQKAPLDATEQQIYQQFMATQRQLQSSLQSRTDAGVDETENIADDSSSSTSSEDSDDEHQGRALNVSAALGHAGRAKRDLNDRDLGVGVLLRKKGIYDFDVRQHKRGRNAIFPYIHHRKRGDEFGEYIKPEDFLRAEEREEADSTNTGQADQKLGQKRKWQDMANERNNITSNKRQQTKKGEPREQKGRFGGSEDAIDGDVSDESDAEPETEPFEGPSKAVFKTVTLTLNARLAFVDFAGLHDQRSLQNLIELINPRKLILMAGTKKETEALAYDCKTLLAAKEGEMGGESAVDIFTPEMGQSIDASVDTHAWIVKLSRDLVKRLHWQNVRNMGVVTLTGQLKGEDPLVTQSDAPGSKTKKQKLLKPEAEEKTDSSPPKKAAVEANPILDLVPASMTSATRSVAQPLHVGDMRLADLRRIMGTAGHTAEFRGEGTLLIDGSVAVRKLGTGKIVVEGSPFNAAMASTGRSGNTFYEVRRSIYEGLAIIAGG